MESKSNAIYSILLNFIPQISSKDNTSEKKLFAGIKRSTLNMYTKFKPSKTIQATKSPKKQNFNWITSNNQKEQDKNRARQVLEEYGNKFSNIKSQHKQNPKLSQKIYLSSTASGQTDDDSNQISNQLTKRKQFTKKLSTSNQVSPTSSQDCISSISLQKNIRQNSQKRQMTHHIISRVNFLSRNVSPKQYRQQGIKQFSTTTSIRQIEQVCSSGEQKREKSPNSTKQKPSKPIKDKTLQIAMKQMLKQLKETRIQNRELKEQLIRIKSHEYYEINREKVKEMICQLQKEKQLRQMREMENLQLKKEISILKSEKQSYKRENCRQKRINAQMKEQIHQVKEENKLLRQRVRQLNRCQSQSDISEI